MEILKDSNKKLHWGQIRGIRNADAPNDIKQGAQDLLDNFNNNVLPTIEFRAETIQNYQPHLNMFEDLPF